MSHIQCELDRAVQCIAINRPEKKNALTAEMYDALGDAVERAEADPAVRVLLLHAIGDNFTCGNDLLDFLQMPWRGQQIPPAVRFIHAVAHANKPVVAAVQGLAVGVGVTILLHCDLVYAAEGAKFMMPFIDLGIVPEGRFNRTAAGAHWTSARGGVADAGRSAHCPACLRAGIGKCRCRS